MPGPGGDEGVIGFDGFLRGFIAGGVVRVGVEFLRAFGGGNEMEDRVIVVPELHFAGVQLIQYIAEFLRGHVGTVVQGTAVADDQDFFRIESPGNSGENLFLGQHQLGDPVLVFPVVAGQPPRRAAVAQLGGGFIHKQDQVALLGKRILDPAHGGRFSGTGTAGDNDPGDGLFAGCFLHLRFLRIPFCRLEKTGMMKKRGMQGYGKCSSDKNIIIRTAGNCHRLLDWIQKKPLTAGRHDDIQGVSENGREETG